MVVGSISTLNDYEGHRLLVDAFAQHCGTTGGRAGHLVVVGGGPAASALRDHVETLPPATRGRVHLVGRVPHREVPAWNALVDVFTVPRLDTPVTRLVTPLKPLSAMVAHSAVLVSDLPPLAELVQDGRGEAVPATVEAWASALGRWLDPGPDGAARRHAAGTAGAHWVERSATWDVVADRSASVYAAVGAA